MAEYNPDDLIGRTFLLPQNEQGERLRATIKRKDIETTKLLDNQHDNAIDKINSHLDVGQRRAEVIMSYVQILDHLEQQEQQEDLYKLRPLTEVWHMAHFWVSYGRCAMPGSPTGRSEGSSRRWTG